MKRPPVHLLLWLAGVLTLLAGVAIRLAGNRPLGGDVLILGALILVISRLGVIRRPR